MIDEALQKRATERWPERPPLLTVEVRDLGPFIELQELILATDPPEPPDFIIHNGCVVVPLSPLFVQILLLARDPDVLIDALFDAMLNFRKTLYGK